MLICLFVFFLLSLSCRKISRKPLLVCFFSTYSQSSGTSGSLVSRLARLALKEIIGRLLTTYGNFNDTQMATNALFPILTYRRSLGSGEANVSRLASWSSWARRSGAAILSGGTLEDKTGKDNMKTCW